MNEILPGLWLGSYPFKDESNLMRVGIKSILTLDLTPLPADTFKTFDKKFIYLIDEPGQNVLDILEDALMFIETSLQEGGVLVHCAMGVSRSATIVIAYIMRKNRVPYETALQLVTSKRLVYPNIGFVNQLKLFQVMGWKVATNSRAYTQYAAMRKFNSSHIIPNSDSQTNTVFKNPTYLQAAYRCRKCRHTLFSSADLVHHCLPERQTICDYKVAETERDLHGIDSVLIKGITLNEVLVPCTNNELFTDFLEWTRPYTHEVEGKVRPRAYSAGIFYSYL
ncbi:Dual specificity phosphatase catalytic domain protein [Paragonimus heterotremus]|uniref:protein-tyrosine-phosphatase n=1 Tax=Paragonimus heterotremus TaxID=100268 RepID=A0A8J4SMV5_9TREM|nr:Dual specificity phosphatase catalytic domain protein [Paragonimus heterotremus]